MSLNFPDERYVRAYTRDTPHWLLGPWEARAVLAPVMRKLDRAGTLDLGDEEPWEALAAVVALPLEVVDRGMAWWVSKGTFELVDGRLVMPRFLEAQGASASDAQRAREHRARTRDHAKAVVPAVTARNGTITNRDGPITRRDGTVTRSHAASQGVTPSCAVPGRDGPSVPSRAEPTGDPPPLALLVGTPQGVQDSDPSKSIPASASRSRKKRPTAPQTLIPHDWKPSASTVAWAEALDVDAEACVDEFVDFWRGRGDSMADWDATFKNRIRTLVARGGDLPRPPAELYVHKPVIGAATPEQVHEIIAAAARAMKPPIGPTT